ncbi:NAD(P)/FAD-dependent oxidoreductase [Pseudomonas typographi]|uniref:NAD(P)/FAD-dependent oxidoreductase n=1 Tax=Pseudomonas typographi TaxID=2715964 RepID=UPI001684D3C3|nr:FAD-binding oxidoreductase [Pseudomonas typographi]MBD1589906.1 FAD-binding oxidoreductase [Pseudomonas typographi]
MPEPLTAHAPSYYAATAIPTPDRPPLAGDHSADVCIIGGGFTGLNTALELAERGRSVIVLEARRIGWGASGRNGGQLIRGLGHDLGQFTRYVGDAGVQQLQRAGVEAVDIVRQRIARHGIACDLRWGYCDLANRPAHYEGFKAELEHLQRLGYEHQVQLVPPAQMASVVGSARYVGGLVDMGSGHLHPLKLAQAEAQLAEALGARLFEASVVTAIEPGAQATVRTAHGSVRANQVVLGCNAYLGDLVPALAGKVLPAGSYIIATEPLGDTLARELIPRNMALCDQRVALDYYRLSADNRLLFGGACHYSGRDPSDIAAYMRPKMLKVFPQLAEVRIDYQWGGMIGISANRFPQLGRVPGHSNLYYAQGYSGHGLNVTHLAARVLAQAICAEDEGALEVFAKVPHRTFPGGQRLRSPLLALGMLWYRIKEQLGGG